jgi:subtilisin-like proprotein convertase family protein
MPAFAAIAILKEQQTHITILSVESIVGHMHNGAGNNCAEKVPQDNNRPIITLPYGDPSGLTIPISTPFELEAKAEIEGSSNVLYTWEQRDAGNDNCIPGEPEPGQNCPLFRSFPPTTDSVRVFPKIENILFNQSSDYEVLPTFSRSMRFACTVRDWNPDGGVIAWDYLSFDVSDAAGPFTVGDINGTFEVGEKVEIKWDPAGTNEAPVDCKTVDIYLSEDGGFTYPHLLQAGVPNTGSYTLALPNVKSNSARIKVKASENVFFNISETNFSIVNADEPGYIARIDPAVQRACPPALTTFFIETQSFGGFSNPISVIDVRGLPPDASFSVEPNNVMPGEITEVRIDWGNTESDNFDLDIIMAASGADTTSISVRTELISNDFTDVKAIYPEPNVENMPQSLTFQWSRSENADNYRIELATKPDFDAGNILVSEALGDIDSFKTQDLLPANTLIYWRVVPINVCGDGSPSPVRVFQTLQLDCQSFTSIDVPKVITASGNGLTQSRLQVFEGGTIANVNVNNLRGDHQFVGDIAAELQSPAGTRVTLFENRCFNSTDFNLSLNDAASTAVVCPLNRGRTYRPKDSLAVLSGEELSGEWEIRIRDRTPGTSGQLKGWGIEVCGSISVEKPQFSSDTIYVAKGESQFIRPQNMQAEKEGNNSGDLLYTIVEAPKRGVITHGQSVIAPGSEFIQYAIDSYHLVYQHDGEDEELDFFSFVLTDKDGGWLGIDTVYIKVDAVLSNDNPTKREELNVFPNPARDYINISLPNRPLEGEIQLLNVFGQEVFKTPLNGSPIYEVPTFNQPSGMYLIRVNSGTLKRTKKVLVQ